MLTGYMGGFNNKKVLLTIIESPGICITKSMQNDRKPVTLNQFTTCLTLTYKHRFVVKLSSV